MTQQQPNTNPALNPDWYERLPANLQKGHFFYDEKNGFLKLILDERYHKDERSPVFRVVIPQAHNIGTWSDKQRISQAVLQFENDTLVEIYDTSHKIHLTEAQLDHVMKTYGLVHKDGCDIGGN